MKIRKLTRKELVEHIKQTIPSDYNEYEKLAFIEFEVAKIFPLMKNICGEILKQVKKYIS